MFLLSVFKKAMLLTALISLCSFAQAQEFIGQALHKQETAARKQAIADLQQNIYVDVQSSTKSYQSNKGDDDFIFTSKLSSTLPILGALTQCYQMLDMVKCDAKLDSDLSSKMYQAAINQKQHIIDNNWQKVKSITSAQIKYQELETLLKLLQETQQLLLVLSIISPSSDVSFTQVSRADVSTQLLALEQTTDSLALAAKLLSKRLANTEKVLVKPFTLYQSSEITPFSTALQTHISQHVNAVSEKTSADFILQGKYRIADKQIHIEAQLINKKGEIVNAVLVSLNKSAVSEFDFEAKQLDFERLLYSGKIVSRDLKAKITTNKGQGDLLFKKGESIKLLVKVNQPSYFYILSHSQNSVEKISYLLDLNDAQGNDKFISYLGYDEVNKWVVIGEFEAQAPFGTESLQLFSTLEKPTALLPNTSFDGTYHVVDSTRKKAIAKTRGLVRKKLKKSKAKLVVSEAVISFTTAK